MSWAKLDMRILQRLALKCMKIRETKSFIPEGFELGTTLS